MRLIKLVILYAALCLGAIGVGPAVADTGALIALAQGDLGKMRFHSDPQAAPVTAFIGADGNPASMRDYRGKYVVLNFWALWCAPCREEMPSLDALNKAVDGLEVVTIATGRNALPAVNKFFKEKGLSSLPKLFDPKMAMARDYGALGLPVTVLIDPQGREIARAAGAVHWDSPQAIKFFETWLSGS
jgi:thiol-disulfide isomerase/thioredoxin